MPLMHSGTITSNVWPEWTLYLTIRHMARDLGYSQFKVSPVPVPSGAGLELGNEMMRPEGKFSVMLPLGKRSYHCANNRQMKCIFPLLKAVLNHHPGPILPVTELRLVLLSVKTPTSNENKTWEQLPHLGLFQQQLVCPRTGNCHLVLESNLGYYDPWNTITKDTDTFWSLVECWGFQETVKIAYSKSDLLCHQSYAKCSHLWVCISLFSNQTSSHSKIPSSDSFPPFFCNSYEGHRE